MSYQNINVGNLPNDGTGDPLRDAFIKINENFALIDSILSGATGATAGIPISSITGLQTILDDIQTQLDTLPQIEDDITNINNTITNILASIDSQNITLTDLQSQINDLEVELNAKLNDAPINGTLYGRKNGTWTAVSSIVGPTGTNGKDGANSLTWTSGNWMDSNCIGFNANLFSDVTIIYVNKVNNLGIDSSSWLSLIGAGDIVQVRNRNDNNKFGTYKVISIASNTPEPNVFQINVEANVCNGMDDFVSELVFTHSKRGPIGETGPSISISGTTGTVVKFTSASSVGNSNITDNGTIVTVSTDATINSVRVGRGPGNSITNVIVGGDALASNTSGTYNVAIGASALALSNANYNVGIGAQTLLSNTSGSDNIAIGRQAMFTNTTGTFNVALGRTALASNTTGQFNTAVGNSALFYGATSSNNVAIGYFSMLNAGRYSLAENNISIGVSSARNLLSGSNNVAIGRQAMFSGTAGSSNTVIGFQSGYNNLGSGNVFIGASAGYNETGSNKLYISNTSTSTPLIYGDFNTSILEINGDTNLKNYGLTGANYIQFNITPTNTTNIPGKLVWNDTDGTLDLGLKGGNVTLQIGQENVVRVVNKSGSDLLESDFRVVRIRLVSEGGAIGQRLAVVTAQANSDANSATTLGIVTETIANNQEGFITISGEVKGINTTGAKSYGGLETWVDGDILYLDPNNSGYLTNVKPTAPRHLIVVGYVVYAHAINGKIFVKVDNGYELGELHDVYVPSPSDKDFLYWNEANKRYEVNNFTSIIGYTPADDSAVVHIWGSETISGPKTFTNNVILGTTTYDSTNNRLDFSGATAAGRIRMNSAGTTTADSIQWGDIAMYRGSANSMYIGQLSTATRHLRINTSALGINLAASGSNTTPQISLSTTQNNTPAFVVGGTDNNMQMQLGPFGGTAGGSGLSITQTWNTTGNSTGVLLNVTDTASGTLSYLMRLQKGGTDLFSVDKNGVCVVASTLQSAAIAIASSNNSTSGTSNVINITRLYNPSSGNAIFNNFVFSGQINQTGTASGISRGLFINPTLTSAADFRGIEVANGSIVLPYTSSSTTYSIKTSDYLVNITGVVNATLPTAVGVTGKNYIIKNTSSGSVTVNTTSSQTIDGSTTYVLGSQYKYVKVVSDGANWLIIGNN